jgi:hypothetical protein
MDRKPRATYPHDLEECVDGITTYLEDVVGVCKYLRE